MLRPLFTVFDVAPVDWFLTWPLYLTCPCVVLLQPPIIFAATFTEGSWDDESKHGSLLNSPAESTDHSELN